jgi:dipeptidyl aminopeptidase/acylaminoacyl peptidase
MSSEPQSVASGMETSAPSLKDRYAIAAALGVRKRDARLLHGPVQAHWAPDGQHFWYTTRDAAGTCHVLVDVQARRKQALFDALALAAALGDALGKSFEAGALPVTALSFDAKRSVIGFSAEGQRWSWRDEGSALQQLGPAFGPGEAVAPSGDAAVSNVGPNLQLRTLARMDVPTALTVDGELDRGYGEFTEFLHQVDWRLQPEAQKPGVLWSPDSQRLAVMRVDLRRVALNHLVQSVPPDGVRPRLHSYRYPMPADAERGQAELWFIGQDGHRVRAQLDPLECSGFTHLAQGYCRWSDDGRHFDLIDHSRDCTRMTLWRIDTHDGSARALIEEQGPVVLPAPAIMERPMFHVLNDGRLIWWSQRSGWGHLYLISTDGVVQAITDGSWLVRSILHVDEDAKQILFAASGREPGVDPYLCAAYCVAFDGSGLQLLTPEPGQHEFLRYDAASGGPSIVAPDGKHFVDVYSTVTTPPRSVLRDRDGVVVVPLEVADPGGAWPAALPLPEPFSVPALIPEALDGASDLWGVLYKPLGFDPGRRYPVVEVIYGAPQTAVAPKAWGGNAYANVAEQLATLGFVAIIVDGPGTAYRSRAFQLEAYGHIERCGGLPDHVNAIRQLAATRAWMDLDRIGITGGSGGGNATVRAMGTFPDFYKVGVAMCGNHDQAGYIAAWGERYQGPYDDALYAAQANKEVAALIVGDLLLIHGDLDNNVHPAMTMQVVDALIRADRNFDLLIVPNAGHMLILLPYVQRRVFDYFVERLMGEAAPRPQPGPP